jgi:hypothetical protein
MKIETRSEIILGATLLLGVLLGVLLVGAIGQWRAGRHRPPRDDSGFVGHVERLIDPRDEAQREAIRPILEAADARNREIVDANRDAMERALEEMKAALAPLLDERQRDRLEEFGARPGDPFGPPPGEGPSRGRRPPPKR